MTTAESRHRDAQERSRQWIIALGEHTCWCNGYLTFWDIVAAFDGRNGNEVHIMGSTGCAYSDENGGEG